MGRPMASEVFEIDILSFNLIAKNTIPDISFVSLKTHDQHLYAVGGSSTNCRPTKQANLEEFDAGITLS